MKRLADRAMLLAACCAAFTLLLSRQAAAQSSDIAVRMTLESDRVVLGEPIVLRWSIKNTSDHPVCVMWSSIDGGYGPYDDQVRPPIWLAVDIVDSEGRSVARRPNLRREPLWDRTKDLGLHTLPPGTSIDEGIALTLWFQPAQAGKYRVIARPSLIWKEGQYPGEGNELTLSTEEALPLTVTMFNKQSLLQIARSLKEQAIAARGRRLPIRKLVSMPEAVVAPVWVELGIADDFHGRVELLELLRGFLKTPTARSAVAEVIRRKPGVY